MISAVLSSAAVSCVRKATKKWRDLAEAITAKGHDFFFSLVLTVTVFVWGKNNIGSGYSISQQADWQDV